MLRQIALAVVATSLLASQVSPARETGHEGYLFHDAHFHLTNYIQEGTNISDYLAMMGDQVGRSTLFGIPLQQSWQFANTGTFAPTYYLETDAPLYYYSFTDAHIAMAYRSLPPEQQQRLDPMITGFNPTDMYAADHIRRVLLTFPGVFSGIGEFSIHKEFVSAKVTGETATLTNRALHRILEFAGEVGLVVILHNDVDIPFPRPGSEPYLLRQMKDLLVAHPDTKVIWAHAGLGRVVRPVEKQGDILDRALANPELRGLYIDLSWDQTAKYITSTPEAIQRVANLINKYPDRFLFGSDVVAPTSIKPQLALYQQYAPLLEALTPQARHAFLFGNYERLFDEARVNVRAWEAENIGKPGPVPEPTPVSGYSAPPER